MYYWIWIIDPKTGDPIVFEDSILPGIIPERTINMLISTEFSQKHNYCKHCGLSSTGHAIDKDGNKYCTMLLHDVLKPKWNFNQLV